MKTIIAVITIIIAMFLVFFNFHLFPWLDLPGELAWWIIPETVSVILVVCVGVWEILIKYAGW